MDMINAAILTDLATSFNLISLLQIGIAVFVRVAPPRTVVERVVRAPGPRDVCVGGYYRWNGHAYMWTLGRLCEGRLGTWRVMGRYGVDGVKFGI